MVGAEPRLEDRDRMREVALRIGRPVEHHLDVTDRLQRASGLDRVVTPRGTQHVEGGTEALLGLGVAARAIVDRAEIVLQRADLWVLVTEQTPRDRERAIEMIMRGI